MLLVLTSVLSLRIVGQLIPRGNRVLRQVLSMFMSHWIARSLVNPWDAQKREAREPSLADKSTIHKIAKLGSDFVAIVQRTGDVGDCSFSTTNFHGLDQQDLLDNGFMELVHVADRPACLEAFSRAVHSNELVRVEVRLRCHPKGETSGYFRWIELTCSSLEGTGEDQILCLARDISHWKEREAELVAREQVAREQIDTKTRLLVNMSHELRTPLNTIIGFSQMMKLPAITAQNERQMMEYAGIIFDSGQDLLGVVDEVLDMSQFDAGEYDLQPQIFSVSDLVSTSVEFVQFEATEKNVRFLITGHEDDLQMNADWAACKQALGALLSAQIKGAAGGRVHLKVKTDEESVKFVVTASMLNGEDGSPDFQTGLQLKNFVDLLSGELDVTRNDNACNELVLRLPQNLRANKDNCNIISITPQLEKSVQSWKKTA